MADDAPDVSTFTPQEKFLYEHHLQNLAMPEAQNEDGTHSSLLATTMSFGDKTYILPSIYNGKRFDKPEDIEREARNVGLENFPSYASPEEADAYDYAPVDKARIAQNRARVAVGSPTTVKAKLMPLIEATEAQELMVTTMIYDHTARRRSYELLPRALA